MFRLETGVCGEWKGIYNEFAARDQVLRRGGKKRRKRVEHGI